jgi:hypothetical protein
MAPLTPEQRRRRDRVETVISLAAPFLNAVLAVGERISRIAEPEDSEYYPVRSGLAEGDHPKRDAAEAPPVAGD